MKRKKASMMLIERADFRDFEVDNEELILDDLVVVRDDLILEILILVILWEESLVVDLVDDPKEKVLSEAKIFR